MIPLKLPLKNKFIVLIGFMGAGKTSLGRGLSKKLNLPHIDTDYEIEKIKNMKISNIFEFYGENYFRELEQDTIIAQFYQSSGITSEIYFVFLLGVGVLIMLFIYLIKK